MNETNPSMPQDAYREQLLANVAPPQWVNPTPAPAYNLVVVGGGTAGLVTALGSAGLGAKVALVEKTALGGDCLNTGCVPSKSLIRSARLASDLQQARELGAGAFIAPVMDFGACMARMRRLRAQLSPHDSAARCQSLGVDVFLGTGHFSGPRTFEVGGQTLHFAKAVIATGARAVHPAIPGLGEAGFLTNETIFNLTECPKRLAIIGGGPLGCELAQTFQRLGCSVYLFHDKNRILDREDPAAVEEVQKTFQREGIQLLLGTTVQLVEKKGTEKIIHYEHQQGKPLLAVDEILVGTGRAPQVAKLGLESAGVRYDTHHGVEVDAYLRTSNRRIFAAGDCCLKDKFTHTAEAAAKVVIQNALFGGRKKITDWIIPRVTYTDPEIAQVGWSTQEAKARGLEVTSFVQALHEVDRAVLDSEENGFVKILVKAGSDKILGGAIVARHAGEMISEITVAMTANLGLGKLAGVIHPYPTQAEAIKQAATAYLRSRLTPRVSVWFKRWLKWKL